MAKRLVQNTQLATTFTDWDYHQADKDRCQLKKDGSFLFGGYMQIPRLAVSLVMTTSLGVDGEGADAPWKDFEIEKLMYGEDDDPYVFLGALFDPTCEGGGSSAVLTTCEAEDEESALGLGGSPQCISDSKMRVAKNIPVLHDRAWPVHSATLQRSLDQVPRCPRRRRRRRRRRGAFRVSYHWWGTLVNTVPMIPTELTVTGMGLGVGKSLHLWILGVVRLL